MIRNRLKIRLLSPLYLVQTAIVLPLVWLTSPSFRDYLSFKQRILGRRSPWVLLRILGKHGAMELGFALPVSMLVSGVFATFLHRTPGAFFVGCGIGFVLLTLLPVVMPMPSREMGVAGADGRRSI